MSTTFPRGARGVAALCLALVVAAACGDGTGSKNPTPTIQNLGPATLLQWSDSTVITITGTGFVDGAVMHLDGAPQLTGFVSASQVVGLVPRAALQRAATMQVTVVNPEPGGGESASRPLTVESRVPWLMWLAPDGALQGDTAATVQLHGVGFSQGSVVRWNGGDRPTTFVHQGELRARIPAADLSQVGTAQVTVFTPAPGGGTSEPRVFSVRVRPNPVPVATALSPSAIVAEVGAQFTLTGRDFMEGTTVEVGGVMPAVTVVSPTELRFALEGENVPNAGFALVRLTNPGPGGGNSNVLTLRVDNPPPVLTALSPAQVPIGLDSLVLRLTGSGFVRGSQVRMEGFTRPSRRISPTELEVVMDRYSLDEYDSISFQVFNDAPGGGTSAALRLAIANPAPVAQAVTPAQATAGLDSLTVRVTGSGFSPNTAVHFQGSPRPTRVVSGTELEAVLPTDDLDEPGTFVVQAVTPPPGGGSTAALTLTLTIAPPLLTELPSYGASAGRSGFPLTVHGTGFLRTSVVRWNGQPRVTRFISSSRLEANVTAADVAAAGTAAVTVHTPGGGTSAARQVTIRPVGPATVTSAFTLPRSVNDIVYDPRTDRIYASEGISPEGRRGSMVLAIDPNTGTVTDSVPVGDMPGQLALSDDGTALWVAVDGSGQVRRLDLPELALGMSFSTGTERVEDMAVMPGQPGTLAIALMSTCCTPRHEGVAIYDHGVRRAQMTPEHMGSNMIAFGESAAVLYGESTEGAGFRTMRVGPGGVSVVRETEIGRTGWHMQYASGRVYTSGGGVIDPGRHELVGAMGAWGYAVAADAALGRAFFADDEVGIVRAYDLNTFQPLGEVTVGGGFTWTMIRWGTDGLALASGNSLRIFRTPLAGP